MNTQPEITMYSTRTCPFCDRAEALLQRKGYAVKKIFVDTVPELKEEMIKRSGGRRTVPQIFINQHHIGGCDDLHDLDSSGQLELLLKDSND